MKVIRARRRGNCSACKRPVVPGRDRVALVGTVWVHAYGGCPDNADAELAARALGAELDMAMGHALSRDSG
jgi:hypothetical protein